MYKVLKSFCCSILFVALNLCGSSAVDYLSFNNFKPFKCAKCSRYVQGSLDVVNDMKQKNENFNRSFNILDGLGFSMPDVYMAYVRSDDRNTLMCDDCGCKDMDKQIKSLVKYFCPGFNFQSPRQQDVENLIHNDSFIQKVPREYNYNVKGFQNGKCICSICLEDQEENKIDVFKTGSYYSCFNCGNLFHEECAEKWLRENFSCPDCRNKFGMIPYDGNICETRRVTFRIWVKNGCSCPLPSDLRKRYLNMNGDDIATLGESYLKLCDRSENDGIPDEFVDLLLPKRIAPESKCSRFCKWLCSCFKC